MLQFIDFCLLSNYSGSRIKKIPVSVLPESTVIILELKCHNDTIMIQRSRKNEKNPTIYVNGKKEDYLLKDAQKYLFQKIFKNQGGSSFRSALAIFNRKERKGFKEIDNPNGEQANKALRKLPYLYLFGLNIEFVSINT